MIHRLTFAARDLDAAIELVVPDAGPVRYELVVSGAAIGDGFVVVRAEDIPPSRTGRLEFRGDGIWAEFVPETPGEHWTFGLEAFGLRVDDPTEEIGDRLAVGYDLEWETPDLVTGHLLVGRTRIEVVGRGSFTVE